VQVWRRELCRHPELNAVAMFKSLMEAAHSAREERDRNWEGRHDIHVGDSILVFRFNGVEHDPASCCRLLMLEK
jgi:hypothetical protein